MCLYGFRSTKGRGNFFSLLFSYTVHLRISQSNNLFLRPVAREIKQNHASSEEQPIDRSLTPRSIAKDPHLCGSVTKSPLSLSGSGFRLSSGELCVFGEGISGSRYLQLCSCTKSCLAPLPVRGFKWQPLALLDALPPQPCRGPLWLATKV